MIKRLWKNLITLSCLRENIHTLDNSITQLQQSLDQLQNEFHKKSIIQNKLNQIHHFTTWIEHATIPEKIKISIIMPTHNRAGFILRAINSVLAQTYCNWELLIIADGCTDTTQEVLHSITDPRIHKFFIPSSGVSAARNHALEHLHGDVVVYLDDDNIMQNNWLKSVAWACDHWPDYNLFIGIRIIDDKNRIAGNHYPNEHCFPEIQFEAFDRSVLLKGNFVDLGVIAHRCSKIRFDESIKSLVDWDLLLQLTLHENPMEIPAIAINYNSDSPNRISVQNHDADYKKILSKHSGLEKQSSEPCSENLTEKI